MLGFSFVALSFLTCFIRLWQFCNLSKILQRWISMISLNVKSFSWERSISISGPRRSWLKSWTDVEMRRDSEINLTDWENIHSCSDAFFTLVIRLTSCSLVHHHLHQRVRFLCIAVWLRLKAEVDLMRDSETLKRAGHLISRHVLLICFSWQRTSNQCQDNIVN